MTHANTEQQKHTPWFAKAGAACSIVPISRTVGPNAFALKGGGYAVLFSAQGTDPESLTDQWSARLEMCQWMRENWTRRAYGTGQEVPA